MAATLKPVSRPEAIIRSVRRVWDRYGSALLLLAAAYMGITGFLRLRYAFYALTALPDEAIDLKSRYLEVHRWFDHLPLYGAVESADYPPASYATLWPLMGWLPLEPTRLLWAFTSAVILLILIVIVVRESRAESRSERLFAALLILPMYATQLTIWLGQLGLHVLVALTVGLILLRRNRASWKDDLLLSVLFLFALVKPTISVPFVWVAVFYPGRMRPIILVITGYVLLTVLAASFQEDPLPVLLEGWLSQGSMLKLDQGTVNIHKWLAAQQNLALPATLLILVGLGFWVHRHRKVDMWLMAGVVALTARIFVHHRVYDDVLILLPMVALFRLAKERPERGFHDVLAALLLAGMWAGTLLPYWTFFETAPEWFRHLVEVGHTVIWLAVLTFLVYQAAVKRSAHIGA